MSYDVGDRVRVGIPADDDRLLTVAAAPVSLQAFENRSENADFNNLRVADVDPQSASGVNDNHPYQRDALQPDQ